MPALPKLVRVFVENTLPMILLDASADLYTEVVVVPDEEVAKKSIARIILPAGKRIVRVLKRCSGSANS
jgi:hypothetical protein